MANIPLLVRAWIFTILLISTVPCCIFVLYHTLGNRTARDALNNHVIIAIVSFDLFYSLTDTIWTTYYRFTRTALSETPAFCYTWTIVDAALLTIIFYLGAWATIERHILIFHTNWLSSWRKRLFIHYLPLIFISLYPFAFNIYTFLSLPCGDLIDYTSPLCGLNNCIYFSPFLGTWDALAHYVIPMFMIVIFGMALLVRVICVRYRAGQRIHWKKYRKLASQVLSMSAVYILFTGPCIFLYLIYTAGVSMTVGEDVFPATVTLALFIIHIVPFICAAQLPDLRIKLKELIRFGRRQRTAVAPTSVGINILRTDRLVIMQPTTRTHVQQK